MTVVTIPRKIASKGDLVVILRKDYEELLRFQKRCKEIDNDLNEAILQVEQGRTIGPFGSAEELRESLEK